MYKDDREYAHEEVVIKTIVHEVLEYLANTNNTKASFTYRPSYSDDFTVYVDAEYIFDDNKEADAE